MEKSKLLELLIEDGWHISDNVDSCSGWDDEAMAESAKEIEAKLLGENQ
jgi:hypothetical protein